MILIGRKYYTVKGDFQVLQFNKKTLLEKTDYSQNYKLFLSKEGILNNREVQELVISIRRNFEYVKAVRDKLTLNHLRRIRLLLMRIRLKAKYMIEKSELATTFEITFYKLCILHLMQAINNHYYIYSPFNGWVVFFLLNFS